MADWVTPGVSNDAPKCALVSLSACGRFRRLVAPVSFNLDGLHVYGGLGGMASGFEVPFLLIFTFAAWFWHE